MKKTICTFVLLALCSSFAETTETTTRGYNERKSTTYKIYTGLKLTFAGSILGDAVTMRMLLKTRDDIAEGNPLMVWWMKSDFSALVLSGAMIAWNFWVAEELWKTNRTAGFILMTLSILVEGYVIYHNLQLFRR